MKTTSYYIDCPKCDEPTSALYLDPSLKGKVCVKCFININKEFPVGKKSLVPCNLCKEPKIRWFWKESYVNLKPNCGKHDEKSSESEDLTE